MKIVYLAGLRHSGSTLLSLLLGNHSRIVCLGEIQHLFQMISDPSELSNPCTCERSPANCPVWGELWKFLEINRDVPKHKLFSLLINRINDIYPGVDFVVDSSKHLGYLRDIRGSNSLEVKVIHLVRDVRSWVFSKRHNPVPAGAPGRNLESYLPGFVRSMVPYLAYKWFTEHRRISEGLRKLDGVESIPASYENLCFHTTREMKRISDFLGVEFKPSLLTPAIKDHHILSGNMMRFNEHKLRSVEYDKRWFKSRRIMAWGWLWAVLLKTNSRFVYDAFDDPGEYEG